jgi:hypothetical protein
LEDIEKVQLTQKVDLLKFKIKDRLEEMKAIRDQWPEMNSDQKLEYLPRLADLDAEANKMNSQLQEMVWELLR